MKLQKFASTSACIGLAILTSGAFAEDASDRSWPYWPQWLQMGAPSSQQGGMCNMGGAGQCGTNQGSVAQGVGSQGGCPMMRNLAALEQRVRQLEQRLNVQNPAQTK
jgi:hypothetical protein